jgi:hypothetical protein
MPESGRGEIVFALLYRLSAPDRTANRHSFLLRLLGYDCSHVSVLLADEDAGFLNVHDSPHGIPLPSHRTLKTYIGFRCGIFNRR